MLADKDFFWLLCFSGLLLVSFAWMKANPALKELPANQRFLKSLVLLGAFMAVIPVAGLHVFHVIWTYPLVSISIWVASFILMISGLVLELFDKSKWKPKKWPSILVGMLALMINAFAMFTFVSSALAEVR